MTSQFIHVEAYGRKADKGGRDVAWILDEVARVPTACSHIDNPLEPLIIFGSSISSLRELHDASVSGATIAIQGGKTRAMPVTQKTLLAVVASHPYTPTEVMGDQTKLSEYENWERDTVRWLESKYGSEFKLAVRHADESHLHIHAYVLPANLRANDLHPGAAAKRSVLQAATDAGDTLLIARQKSDAAYKSAMSEWQNDYHAYVSVRHGHTKSGLGRKRLTRAQWFQSKLQEKVAG